MPGLTEEQAIQYLISANQLTQGQAAAYAAAKPKLALMEQVYAAVTGGVDRPMDKAGFFTAMLMLSDISKLPPQQQTPENIASVLAKKALYAQTGKALSQLNQDHNMSKITGLLENLERLLAHLGSGGPGEPCRSLRQPAKGRPQRRHHWRCPRGQGEDRRDR